MCRTAPLILGAGPAGCAAAIALAKAGAAPLLIDRDKEPRDQLCGGFLSWRTVALLQALGIDPAKLGAPRVERLALIAGAREAVLPLPQVCFALSRRALDGALRRRAREAFFELGRASSTPGWRWLKSLPSMSRFSS